MSLLKVCGVTDGAFAIEAARLGADFLGFVFADGSVRRIGAEKAGIIVSQTRQSALRAPRFAGVFTCGGAEEIAASARRASLDIVQLHWNADDGTVHALKRKVSKCGGFFPAISAAAQRRMPSSSTGASETKAVSQTGLSFPDSRPQAPEPFSPERFRRRTSPSPKRLEPI